MRTAAILRMVLTTPEAIIEQASTQKLLDVLIDESVRTSARRPIMMQFDPSSGWIWRRWKGTVFSETWISCVRNMIYALLCLYLYRMFPRAHGSLTGFSTLWGQLLSVTSLTITFFVNQSYALWRKCYEYSRRLQGRLHDIDMTLAMHAARKLPPSPSEPSTYTSASRQLLDLVSRYVRLFNLLTYASFTRSHRPILTPRGMRRLVERGLLTAQEREVLIDAEIPATQRHNCVLMWITRIFVEGRQAGHFIGGSGFEQQFMEKIHVIRAQYGAIGDELQGRMPLAYAHIVQVLVDCVLMMYPLMAFSSGMSPLLGVLGTGLLTTSYQGLFDLAKQFLDPYDNENYGRGEDPLCVDTLIAETNAGSLRWMYGFEQMPVSSQRIKDGELFDYMLPVRGYSVQELEKMEEERIQKEIELKELREREEAERLEAERLKAEEMEALKEEEDERWKAEEIEALKEEEEEAPEEAEEEPDEAITLHDSTRDDGRAVEELAEQTNIANDSSNRTAESSTETESPSNTQMTTTMDESVAETLEENVTAESVEEADETLHKVTLLESGLPVSLSSPEVNQTDSQVADEGDESVTEEELTTQHDKVENATAVTSNDSAEVNVVEADSANLTETVEIEREMSIGNSLHVDGAGSLSRNNNAHHDDGDEEDEETEEIDFALVESEIELLDEMEDFESFQDLPWFDEVGPDGQEVRLSQMLADEEWEEEQAYELEKASLSSPLTLADYQKERAELVEAAENEMLETELVMMASPGAEGRAIESTDKSSARPSYDQTQLSGVAQLWGLPPDEDLPRRVPQTTDLPFDGDNFDGISQLWGKTPGPSSLSEEPSNVAVESSFEYMNQLWDEAIGDADFESTEQVDSADNDEYFENDDDEELDLSAYEGLGLEWHEESQGDRLSQLLADETWEYEEEPEETIRTLEDYTKKVVEILEAAEDEILETEAILRAPPAAESVAFVEREDVEEPLLQAVNETRPIELTEETDEKEHDMDLDALEMDVDPQEVLSECDELLQESGTTNSTSAAAESTTSEEDFSGANSYLESLSGISDTNACSSNSTNPPDDEPKNNS